MKIITMSKIIFFISSFFFFSPYKAEAISWEIIGPCSSEPLYKGEKEMGDNPLFVGTLTLQVLQEEQIPYQGDERSIVSIVNTPTGMGSMEVLDDQRMRAYGWCYEVNGIQPDVYMDSFYFKDNKDHLKWFYGYSLYESGEWKEYCTKAYKVKPDFLCKKTP